MVVGSPVGGELTQVAISEDVVPQLGVARFAFIARVVGLDAVVHIGDQRSAVGIALETLSEADITTIGARLRQIVLVSIEVILATAAGIVAAAHHHRTTDGQVGGLTRTDVDLTRQVNALVGRVVEETSVVQVILMRVSSGSIGTDADRQRIGSDLVHVLVSGTIVTSSRTVTILVVRDIKSEEETEEGFLVVLLALDERSLQATTQAAVAVTVNRILGFDTATPSTAGALGGHVDDTAHGVTVHSRRTTQDNVDLVDGALGDAGATDDFHTVDVVDGAFTRTTDGTDLTVSGEHATDTGGNAFCRTHRQLGDFLGGDGGTLRSVIL